MHLNQHTSNSSSIYFTNITTARKELTKHWHFRASNSRMKKEKSDRKPIRIDQEGFISQSEVTKNCMSAIAAVDYALRETKPSCGLGTGF